MKITILTARRSTAKTIRTDKAQSLLIQTEGHNLLFGFGSGKTALKNMRALGISSDLIDIAVLPFGNAEQGGGLTDFLKENRRAVVYARIPAFEPHYKKSWFGVRDMSLKKELRDNRRILRCKNYFLSKDGRFVTFSLPSKNGGEADETSSSDTYFVKDAQGRLLADSFSHETYLLVRENKNWTLFCGEAHAGIESIVKEAQTLVGGSLGGKIIRIVGGVCLGMDGRKNISAEHITEVLGTLTDGDTEYYTESRNGSDLFRTLQDAFGGRLREIFGGERIEF